VTYTYFDTEPQGKFVLGLVYWPGGAPPAGPPGKVSHLAPVVRESETVSAYWQKAGLSRISHGACDAAAGFDLPRQAAVVCV
jgi:hypothetical protein